MGTLISFTFYRWELVEKGFHFKALETFRYLYDSIVVFPCKIWLELKANITTINSVTLRFVNHFPLNTDLLSKQRDTTVV